MRRLTLGAVALYVLVHIALTVAYIAAWLTDFEREDHHA